MNPNKLTAIYNGDDWDSFLDLIIEALDVKATREQAMALFEELPEEIQEIAFAVGFEDTAFKDHALEAIKEFGLTIP